MFDGKTGRAAMALVFGAAFAAAAAGRPTLTFPRDAELPASGLKIKLMPEAVEAPPAPPTTYRYTVTRGPEQWATNLFAPAELWRESQSAGQWRDRFGTRLTIATVTVPCPAGFAAQHVSREDYEQAAGKAGNWTTNTLAEWVQDFAGEGQVTLLPLRHSVRFKQLYNCQFGPAAANKVGCLAQFNRPSGSSAGPWFFALFELAEGLPLQQARDAVFGSFAEGFIYTGVIPGRAQVNAQAPRPPPGRNPAGASAELAQSREQVANSIRNMKNWWFVETRHYIILSNLKQGAQTLVNHLQGNMERLWAGYAQLVPPVVPETSVGVIRVFATAEEYTAYVGAEHAWTSGLWNPFKQELTIRPNDWGGSREKENHLLRVVYHEAFHQYLFLATGGIQAAAWFNEGHASLFENARIAGGRLDVEEDPARLAVLMEMIQGSKANLKELLPLTYQEFYAGDNQQRQERYALAWALVYYLRKGAAAERTPYAHQVCQRYLEALIQTKDGDAATRAAFDGIDLARLTADFTRFWLSNHKRAKADRNRVVK